MSLVLKIGFPTRSCKECMLKSLSSGATSLLALHYPIRPLGVNVLAVQGLQTSFWLEEMRQLKKLNSTFKKIKRGNTH